MNSNTVLDFRNPTVIRKAGMSALVKELGTVGAVYFLRQCSEGRGDYTAEREKLLEGITLDDVVRNVRERDKQSL